MKKSAIRAFASLSLALALTTLGGTAQAAVVNYSFTVTTDNPVGTHGQNFSGAFSFDDTEAPTPGISGEDLYTLTSYSFNFNGTNFGIDDLSDKYAAFELGNFSGLEVSASVFSFLPASVPFAASFAFDLGQGNAGNGSVIYDEIRDPNPNSVPEPATGALLAVGLLAAASLRRKRTR